MPSPPTISFLVPAAGCGSRAGLGANKILAPLRGCPVLAWTLAALADPASVPPASTCSELLVAARREEWPLIEGVFALFEDAVRVKLRVVEGGATRQDSVEKLALAASGDYVAVHDAARPLAEPTLISRVVQAALEGGAAMAAMPASDTVKIAEGCSDSGGAHVAETLDRALVWLAQTPQAFERNLLLRALESARGAGFQGTDCASLVERWRGSGGEAPRVRLVEGSARNFKITFAHDLERAERELQGLQVLGEGD